MLEAPNKKNVNDKGVVANSFKAFEAVVAQFKMFWHMVVTIAVITIVLLVATLLITNVLTHDALFFGNMDKVDACILKTYYKITIKDAFGLGFLDKNTIKYTCEDAEISMPYNHFRQTFGSAIKTQLRPKFRRRLVMLFLGSLMIFGPLYMLLIRKLHEKHLSSTADKFIRGKKIVAPEEMAVLLQDYEKKGIRMFPLNQHVAMPESIVTRHNFIVGKPGSGKSQLINRIIDILITNGIKVVIHDFKGDFIPAFYDCTKHYIFNPVDKRHLGAKDKEQELIQSLMDMKIEDINADFIKNHGYFSKKSKDLAVSDIAKTESGYGELLDFITDVIPHIRTQKYKKIAEEIERKERKYPCGWTVFSEINSLIDIDAFASSVIADTMQDKYWTQSPRDILKGALIYCIKSGNTTNEFLCKMLKSGTEELKKMFAEYPDDCAVGAQHLIDAKVAGQLLSILASNTDFMKYLNGTDGDFSIAKWIEDPNSEKTAVFVSNMAKLQKTLAPLIATFFDFATKSLCSMPDDLNRRLYFILDEFGQLTRIDSIVQLLSQARSKGGAAFLLIQDQAQIANIYGQDLVKTIVNNCGNKIYLSVSDSSTAELISNELGTIEIERSKESKSFGVGDFKDTISQNADIVEQKIALPSEIMSLKTMRAYVQMTDLPLTMVDIDYKKVPYNCPAYVGRDFSVRVEQAKAVESAATSEQAAVPEMSEDEELGEVYGESEGIFGGNSEADRQIRRECFGDLEGFTEDGVVVEPGTSEAVAGQEPEDGDVDGASFRV